MCSVRVPHKYETSVFNHCPFFLFYYSGYWPLIDRFNNYWMQIVYDGPPIIGCIDGWVARGVIKPVVDAVMVGCRWFLLLSFRPLLFLFRMKVPIIKLCTVFPMQT